MTSSAANRRTLFPLCPKIRQIPTMTFPLPPFISLIHSLLSIQFPSVHSFNHLLLLDKLSSASWGLAAKKVGNDDWGHSSNSFGPTTTKKVWPSEVKRQQKGPNLLPNSEYWPRKMLIHILFCLLLLCLSSNCAEDQTFYELLGVSQDADLLSIRKAFKRLAIQKHPDKNPDDPNAHSNFVRINRAYEVLKDEELRRKYDQFGEKGLEEGAGAGGEQYQSWQFYRDNFGIYDENPEVTTLSRADFQEEVFQSGEIWFVNFYSAYCSHCHLLAPVWRELAKQMPEGVVRIGAVNCAEDPHLCQSQRVTGYPSLVLYPKMEFYKGPRDQASLLAFILSRHPAQILRPLVGSQLPPNGQKPILYELCSSEDCLSEEERKKIAAIASQLGMAFAVLDCAEGKNGREWCEKMFDGHHDGLFFMAKNGEGTKELLFADLIDLRTQLLAELPTLVELDAADMDWLLQRPPSEDEATTLAILFPDQTQMDGTEWRRFGLLFPNLEIRAVPCHRVAQQCAQMHAGQMPRPALFRPKQGGFDMDYGNTPEMDVRRVAKFVRRSLDSSVIVLNPDKYWEARQSEDVNQIWLIDFFAPWCPPCLRLLNELRKLPSKIAVGNGEKQLHIGTMNCEAHPTICQEEGVNSYPRTVLVFANENGINSAHKLVGFHSADDLLEFIDDALSPSVQHLDESNFDSIVHGRSAGQLFFVDFFAPWCGPCQQLAPEFRRLARQWAKANPKTSLTFGSVDCEQNGELCRAEGIRSYPSLRLYRHDAGQLMAPADYPQNWWRNAQTMAHWLGEMMPSMVQKLAGDFATTVLDSTKPFLVDFYAPWCSHCVQFAPTFERVAQLLDGQVQLGKVDCERFGWICQSAGVNAFPSIFLYFGADQRGQRQSSQGMAVAHGQDADKIADRVRQLLAHHQQRRMDQRDEL